MDSDQGYLLAIDVGSTTARCILFDLEGRPVGEAYREPRAHHPQPDWTEVDPEEWWTCTVAATRQVLEGTAVHAEEVRAIGLCGLKHAVVPIDANGTALARAMLWMDQRCRPQAEWLSREHGDLIEEVTGGRAVSTTPSAPKLRWIVENEPDLLRSTYKFLLAKDWIRFRLTGTIATDPTDAGGTRLYDPRSGGWSEALLERIDVPVTKMPPILPSTAIAGEITPEVAAQTGLAAGTPVVVGGGDVRCTLIGADAFGSSRACLYLGTAAWLSLPASGTAQRRLSADLFGATATTGAALKWLSALFDPPRPDCTAPTYGALEREAASAPLGARGLLFLPHLMGERGPKPDPRAKGTLYGLTLAHGRGDIARAVLEGCAFQLRHIAEGLLGESPSGADWPGPVVVVGGGAKSALWRSILADVMGVPLLIPRVVEAGALGAAILAGVGVGIYADEGQAAARLVEIVDQAEPDPARQQAYRPIYSLFLELEERVGPMYAQR